MTWIGLGARRTHRGCSVTPSGGVRSARHTSVVGASRSDAVIRIAGAAAGRLGRPCRRRAPVGAVRRGARAAVRGRCTDRRRGGRSADGRRSIPTTLRAATTSPVRSGELARPPYVARRPSAWRTTTYRTPATVPLNVTSPAATARTTVPPGVPYSSPRLPAHHAHGGGRNGSTTGASTGGSQQASAADRAGDQRQRQRRQCRHHEPRHASTSTSHEHHDHMVDLRDQAGAGGQDRESRRSERRAGSASLRRRRRPSTGTAGGARTWCGSATPGSR